MFEKFTPAVTRALQAAQDWAGRTGAADVQPVHLLLGLLEEDQGRAATLFTQAGLDPAAVRARLAGNAPPAPHPVETPPPPSPEARDTLAHARELAADLNAEPTIASEHLLLAVVQQDPSLRETLEGLGLDFAR